MKRKMIVSMFAVALFLLGMSAQNAQATLIDFEGVASGTMIDNQYTGLGVTFSSVSSASGQAYAVSTGDSSHLNGVSLFSSDPTFAAEEGAVKAVFSTLQSSVSIDAKLLEALEFLGTPLKWPFIQAFDSSGNYLQTVYYDASGISATANAGPWETLTLTRGSADISYVLFSSQANATGSSRSYGGIYGMFDNLTFAGTETPPPTVPEPSVLLLFGAGLSGLGLMRNRFKK